jgi:L-asparaginase
MQAISTKSRKKVVVLGTGGTIAGTAQSADEALSYNSAQLGVKALLEAVPGLSCLPVDLLSEQVAQLDSKDMGFDVLHALARRVLHCLLQAEVAAVVITHGTDTLEETAFFLHATLPPESLLDKSVVLTCAMRPATSKEADGPQNLLDAVTLASLADISGLFVVCAGQIHSGLHVQKVHPYRLNAFDSGDVRPLGTIQAGSVVMLTGQEPGGESGSQPDANFWRGGSSFAVIANDKAATWPRVEIIMSHTGADGRMVDGLLAEFVANEAGAVLGIVVAGTGNGTVHGALEAALVRARIAGVRVWRSSRCAYGAVRGVPGLALPEFTPLSPVKARIALILDLLCQQQRAKLSGLVPQTHAS